MINDAFTSARIRGPAVIYSNCSIPHSDCCIVTCWTTSDDDNTFLIIPNVVFKFGSTIICIANITGNRVIVTEYGTDILLIIVNSSRNTVTDGIVAPSYLCIGLLLNNIDKDDSYLVF